MITFQVFDDGIFWKEVQMGAKDNFESAHWVVSNKGEPSVWEGTDTQTKPLIILNISS